MQKILGVILILLVSMIAGYQLRQGLYLHLHHMLVLKEVILALKGEISYGKMPVPEVLCKIAVEKPEPFGPFLEEAAKRIGEERGKHLSEIWKESLKHHEKDFISSREEYWLVEHLGDNLGSWDRETQIHQLEIVIGQVEHCILEVEKEIAVKQRLYPYLTVMCGLFVILILI